MKIKDFLKFRNVLVSGVVDSKEWFKYLCHTSTTPTQEQISNTNSMIKLRLNRMFGGVSVADDLPETYVDELKGFLYAINDQMTHFVKLLVDDYAPYENYSKQGNIVTTRDAYTDTDTIGTDTKTTVNGQGTTTTVNGQGTTTTVNGAGTTTNVNGATNTDTQNKVNAFNDVTIANNRENTVVTETEHTDTITTAEKTDTVTTAEKTDTVTTAEKTDTVTNSGHVDRFDKGQQKETVIDTTHGNVGTTSNQSMGMWELSYIEYLRIVDYYIGLWVDNFGLCYFE